MKWTRLALMAALLSPLPLAAVDQPLPTLGDSTSALVSLEKEHQLGQSWARLLRGRATLLDDPLVYGYLYDLVWYLAGFSQLPDKRLELIVLDNPTMNAFAVPGGVIGIHAGLLLSAEQEDELASVITHEFAHLSQRHFAAQLEQSRRTQPLALVTMLASLLIMAADGNAGQAALTSSLAAQQSSRLAFSRQNEREADRIGMQNLVEAGLPAEAMPRMFARMQKSLRFESKIPEFLLTHPVTEARLADSLNRAAQLPAPPPRPATLDFTLLRTRLQVHYSSSAQQALQRYQQAARTHQPEALYGLAVAAIRLNQQSVAEQALDQLPPIWQQHILVRLTRAENALASEQWSRATTLLRQSLALYPGHYAGQKLLADAYLGAQQPEQAIAILEQLKQDFPQDPGVWSLLAEALGQVGRELAVHEARIEYFLLIGQTDQALQQVGYARHSKGLTPSDLARLAQLEADIHAVREALTMRF